MTYRLSFELPILPAMTNKLSTMHWRAKGKAAKEIHRLVGLAASPRPLKPLPRARMTCTRFSSQVPDYDGLVSSFKHVIDGLVVCGVLEDDSLENIGMPEFHWMRTKPKLGRIEIEVEEIMGMK